MASFARASMGRSFSGGINVAFIRTRSYFLQQQQLMPPTPRRHAIFAFLVQQLLNFLQLQIASPFETHPNTMFVAITSLLIYCFAYDAELRSSSTGAGAYAPVINRVKVVSDSLCLVCLTSILFPDKVRLVLYLVYTLFLAIEFVFEHCPVQMLWRNWLHQRQRVMNRRPAASTYRGGLLPVYQ